MRSNQQKHRSVRVVRRNLEGLPRGMMKWGWWMCSLSWWGPGMTISTYVKTNCTLQIYAIYCMLNTPQFQKVINTVFISALYCTVSYLFPLSATFSSFLIFGWWLLFLFHWEDRINQNRTFHKPTPCLTYHILYLLFQPPFSRTGQTSGPLPLLFAMP